MGEHDELHDLIEELKRKHEELERLHPWRAWLLRRWGSVRYFFRDLRVRLRWIKWGWQRARRGYSEYDTWSFDAHIARVIGHGLIDLRDNTHSYPVDSSPREWWHLLTEMAEPLVKYGDSNPLDGTVDEAQDIYANAVAALHLVADHLGDLWD